MVSEVQSGITLAGRKVAVKRIATDTAESLSQIAVGTGSAPFDPSDTALDNEIFRGDVSLDTVAVQAEPADEQIRASINVGAGTEVPVDSQITEFGIFSSNDRLVYREVRPPTEDFKLEDGQRVVFQILIDVLGVS